MAVTRRLASSCAGWPSRPTAAELYAAIHAQETDTGGYLKSAEAVPTVCSHNVRNARCAARNPVAPRHASGKNTTLSRGTNPCRIKLTSLRNSPSTREGSSDAEKQRTKGRRGRRARVRNRSEPATRSTPGTGQRALEGYVVLRIGARPAFEGTSGDVLEIVAPIWQEKPETARRVRHRHQHCHARPWPCSFGPTTRATVFGRWSGR